MIVSDSENAAIHLGANRTFSVVVCPAQISNITGLASNVSPSCATPVVANDYKHIMCNVRILHSEKIVLVGSM